MLLEWTGLTMQPKHGEYQTTHSYLKSIHDIIADNEIWDASRDTIERTAQFECDIRTKEKLLHALKHKGFESNGRIKQNYEECLAPASLCRREYGTNALLHL